jgi:hypothetical protein
VRIAVASVIAIGNRPNSVCGPTQEGEGGPDPHTRHKAHKPGAGRLPWGRGGQLLFDVGVGVARRRVVVVGVGVGVGGVVRRAACVASH